MARFVARRSKSLSSYGEGLTCYSRSGADEPATILLVDDRDANLLALEAVLEPLQQRLVRARSGREALRFLLEEDCALILLDVQMPELDGFETAALIRERERNRYTPIIFVTAVSREEEHILKGYANGAVDYVVKPFTPETMIAKVRIFLDQHRREEGLKREAIMRSQERDEFERREDDYKHQLRILISLRNIGNGGGSQNGAAIKDVAMQVIAVLAGSAAESGSLPAELKAILHVNVGEVAGKLGAEAQKQIAAAIPGELGNELSQGVEDPQAVAKDPAGALQRGASGILGGNTIPTTQPTAA